MTAAKRRLKKKVSGNDGFTLIEIIAVLTLIGILAAVALPRYYDMVETGRKEVAEGKISEMRGYFNMALASYKLKNNGDSPASGKVLLDHYNTVATDACTSVPASDGDGTKTSCSGDASNPEITITVSAVQSVALATAVSGNYGF